MGRQTGSRNKDHDEVRARLAQSVAMQMLQSGGSHPTLKQLAAGAGVDPGTLRHYFVDRRGVVRAAFEQIFTMGKGPREQARALGELPAQQGLELLVGRIVEAWKGLLGGMHATGFVEGIVDPELGRAYVAAMLEPTLHDVEQLLTIFAARGELEVPDARVASLGLLAPVLLGLFHQHQLHGVECRPLDVSAFAKAHLQSWLRGYGPKES